jgi:DNA-binding MurR/RpiR family transcriptional regulator
MADSPAQEYMVLREEISSNYDSLSKRLRQIASFALDHPTEMAMDTIAVIAERAEVQPSALIRFAKAFGYSGFSEMQKAFQAHVAERSASYKERIRSVLLEAEAPEHGLSQSLLHQYCAANIVSLEHLRDSAPNDDIAAAVKLLEAAGHVYVMAQRRSFPVASYLAYALNHSDCRTHLMDGVGGLLSEQAQVISKEDVLIAISFHPYSEETSHVVSQALSIGAKVIVITDSSLSPIARDTDVCFEVHDAEVHSFRSLTASMCLAQTLAMSLVFRDK